MPSIEDTLLNGTPAQSDLSGIADALRRRSQMGLIGVASGLPGVSDAGTDLMRTAGNDMQDIIGNQHFAQQQAQQLSEHADTVNQQAADLAERTRSDKAEEALKDEMMQERLMLMGVNNPVVAQNQKILEPQVQKLQAALTKSKIPEFESALNDYDGMVQKYTDPQTGKVGNIPGIGYQGNFPYYAQIESALFPQSEAAVNRGNAQRLLNTFLNVRFGARGGTASNVELMKQELGQSVLTGQGVDVKLMDRAKALINAEKQNIYAGVSPAASAMYKLSIGDTPEPVEADALRRAQGGEQLLNAEANARAANPGHTGGAPAQALAYLKAHPETSAQFQKTFGYLPTP